MNGGIDVASTTPWADGSRTMRHWTAMAGLLATSGGGADARRLAQEGQQFAVDLGGVGHAHDVRAALDLYVVRVGQRRVQAPAVPVDGQDPVGGAVEDERRDVDPLDVPPEVVEPAADARPRRDRRRRRAGVPGVAHRLLAHALAVVVVEVEEV